MSDTPRTDAACNIYDLQIVAEDIERELNAATSEIERLTSKVSQLYEGAEEQKDRIKRLEEDLMDAKNQYAALVADVALYEDRGERIKRLETALRKIANQDYRGNRSTESQIAVEALKP